MGCWGENTTWVVGVNVCRLYLTDFYANANVGSLFKREN